MTETILKVKLSELSVVRIACRKGGCTGIIELGTQAMGMLNRGQAVCPLCHEALIPTDGINDNPFVEFARVVKRLLQLDSQASVEFPVRVDDAKG